MADEAKSDVLGEALVAAQTTEDAKIRVNALVPIAPHVSGGQLGKALAAAVRAIKDAWKVLLAFPFNIDSKVRVREIRCCLTEYLEKQLSSESSVPTPSLNFVQMPILGNQCAAALVRYINEINRWRWLYRRLQATMRIYARTRMMSALSSCDSSGAIHLSECACGKV